jgi:hypothetical protein
MRFVLLDLLTGLVASVINLDASVYDRLVSTGNPKANALRPLVTDPQPTPGPTQRVVKGPIVVEPTQARETWVIAQKTAEEIAAEQEAAARAAEYQHLRTIVDALRNGTGTAAERLVRVERVSVRLLLDAFAENQAQPQQQQQAGAKKN